jgi:hypothetical protein
MNRSAMFVLVAAAAALGSEMVVKQFTDGGDSPTERTLWRVGSAAAIGFAAAKLMKG